MVELARIASNLHSQAESQNFSLSRYWMASRGEDHIHGFFQVKGLGEYCAANDGVKLLVTAQVAYLLTKQRKAWHSVCFSKCLLGKTKQQCRVPDKECTSHDLISGFLDLNKKSSLASRILNWVVTRGRQKFISSAFRCRS